MYFNLNISLDCFIAVLDKDNLRKEKTRIVSYCCGLFIGCRPQSKLTFTLFDNISFFYQKRNLVFYPEGSFLLICFLHRSKMVVKTLAGVV